eukprot:XP_001706709.1 Hypothetical protein GL50803_112435 [Giardia lamblia ATCC 50803]
MGKEGLELKTAGLDDISTGFDTDEFFNEVDAQFDLYSSSYLEPCTLDALRTASPDAGRP